MKAFFTLITAFIIIIPGLMAQSSETQSPYGYSSSGSGASWANLTGVLFIDNSPAYADLAQYPNCNLGGCYYSNVASFTNFGFTIPLNATIHGIKVDVVQRVSSPGGGIRDSSLVLVLNGTALSSDYADPSYWLDTPTSNVYGDSTDTWAYSWTVNEINDPGFGLEYRLTNDSYDQPASLDYLSMTVFYQTGTGISSQSSTSWNIGFIENHLMISAEASVLAKGLMVEVSDIQGKVCFTKNVEPGNRKLDLNVDASSWLNGIYFLNITSDEGYKLQRKLLLRR